MRSGAAFVVLAATSLCAPACSDAGRGILTCRITIGDAATTDEFALEDGVHSVTLAGYSVEFEVSKGGTQLRTDLLDASGVSLVAGTGNSDRSTVSAPTPAGHFSTACNLK